MASWGLQQVVLDCNYWPMPYGPSHLGRAGSWPQHPPFFAYTGHLILLTVLWSLPALHLGMRGNGRCVSGVKFISLYVCR